MTDLCPALCGSRAMSIVLNSAFRTFDVIVVALIFAALL